MNTYIVEESENRRFLGALFLSILIHVALLVLIKTTGWGPGFSDFGVNRGGSISVQMGFEDSRSTVESAGRSSVPAKPEEPTREGDRSARREVTVSQTIQKPAALARPVVQPRTEVSPESSLQPKPEAQPKPQPQPQPQPKPEPEPQPKPEPARATVPEPEPEPQVKPVDKPEPPMVEATEPVEPVMEVQRQPSEEPAATEEVLTSTSGVTTLPVAESPSPAEPVEAPQTITEEPAPQAIDEPQQVPDTAPSDHTGDGQTTSSSTTTGSSEVGSQSESGTEGGTDGQTSEQVGEPDGEPTGSPQPPPPPPAGGDMLGIGGRLVYPKAAETARGGPIEYSVTYEVLVSTSGQVLDLTVASQWFDRDLDERTKQDLLRTAELMMRGLITFGAYTSNYRMTVELSFDAESGPALRPESRIRPVSDRD